MLLESTSLKLFSLLICGLPGAKPYGLPAASHWAERDKRRRCGPKLCILYGLSGFGNWEWLRVLMQFEFYRDSDELWLMEKLYGCQLSE